MNLANTCTQTIAVVKEVGQFIQSARKKGFSVEEKSINSLVTEIDKAAEKKLINQLLSLLPEAGILGEEGIANKTAGQYKWVIDPLDGTTNFIHGVPCYSVSVALMDGKEVMLGVVYEINLDECFYAWKNGGAYLNGQSIHTSKNNALKNALIATGFPYYDYQQMDNYLALFQEFMKTTRGLRRLGSAAVDLVYVACGRFDGFYEYSLNAWDVAAGALIVQEAGGKVSDFSGKNDYVFGKEIVAAGSGIFENFLGIVQKHF